ncbi:hypothetical protein CLOBOL_00678 [Enterocloster bolteae ATCC BAA-613]|uniref:Uncharacterized protein n=1 Tax=Enterocloster bolteae (strain ATCC BAA-613 / DSM 15670 / CCUG 46953 / JCM 12243 / WAL 16351) TaxID=411902 RepID=A8RIF3_ENTBW|nr:hypothetical protein CGC65_11420 [Enterocloster bolteae]EDP19242.1 hypothetical protein CLOBOL_00678 [Enterocloster bolteae ATCC BAA-613]PQL53521.1 hypothetical protein C5Z06_26080 [Enterocloster bolteae]
MLMHQYSDSGLKFLKSTDKVNWHTGFQGDYSTGISSGWVKRWVRVDFTVRFGLYLQATTVHGQ